MDWGGTQGQFIDDLEKRGFAKFGGQQRKENDL
jgi:hypothetical protein